MPNGDEFYSHLLLDATSMMTTEPCRPMSFLRTNAQMIVQDGPNTSASIVMIFDYNSHKAMAFLKMMWQPEN